MSSAAGNRLHQALDTLVERITTPAGAGRADRRDAAIGLMRGFAAEHSPDVRPHVKKRRPGPHRDQTQKKDTP
ncbi:hypothetical protein ALMP_79360 [Streptomyces sp. A012304]|nr:hypothetical protein ALMP_79360 [Streptomyces sp. A012304]